MAYCCVCGMRAECNGCGECNAAPVLWDIYETPIYVDDEYYEIDGEVIAQENIEEWLSDFKKIAEVETNEDSIVDDIRSNDSVR